MHPIPWQHLCCKISPAGRLLAPLAPHPHSFHPRLASALPHQSPATACCQPAHLAGGRAQDARCVQPHPSPPRPGACQPAVLQGSRPSHFDLLAAFSALAAGAGIPVSAPPACRQQWSHPLLPTGWLTHRYERASVVGHARRPSPVACASAVPSQRKGRFKGSRGRLSGDSGMRLGRGRPFWEVHARGMKQWGLAGQFRALTVASERSAPLGRDAAAGVTIAGGPAASSASRPRRRCQLLPPLPQHGGRGAPTAGAAQVPAGPGWQLPAHPACAPPPPPCEPPSPRAPSPSAPAWPPSCWAQPGLPSGLPPARRPLLAARWPAAAWPLAAAPAQAPRRCCCCCCRRLQARRRRRPSLCIHEGAASAAVVQWQQAAGARLPASQPHVRLPLRPPHLSRCPTQSLIQSLIQILPLPACYPPHRARPLHRVGSTGGTMSSRGSLRGYSCVLAQPALAAIGGTRGSAASPYMGEAASRSCPAGAHLTRWHGGPDRQPRPAQEWARLSPLCRPARLG